MVSHFLSASESRMADGLQSRELVDDVLPAAMNGVVTVKQASSQTQAEEIKHETLFI